VDGIDVGEETLHDYYRGHRDSLVAPERLYIEMAEFQDMESALRVAERMKEGRSLHAFSDPDAKLRVGEGWIVRRNLPMDLQRQAGAAEPGDVLGPLEANGKVRVLRIRERQPQRMLTYDESREFVRQRLIGMHEKERLNAWYEQAKRNAELEFR
jgi:hypothetical protein